MLDSSGTIAESANIVKESVVIGDVSIGAHSTVLFGAVLRGDDNPIIIGEGTNVQDNCTIHTSQVDPAILGNHVTVGHNAIIHGCKVGDNTLIGMGAKVTRKLTGEEIAHLEESAMHYIQVGEKMRERGYCCIL